MTDLLTVSPNEYTTPISPSEVRSGQFFRTKTIEGKWSPSIHLALDVRAFAGDPPIRRFYNFNTGECYGPVPESWKCYVLDAKMMNGVGEMMPVRSFPAKG